MQKTIYIGDIPEGSTLNSGEYKSMELSIGLNRGGRNYFNGEEERMGYYLHLSFMDIGKDGFIRFSLGGTGNDSFKFLLKEVKRKSSKTEDLLVAEIKKQLPFILNEFKNGKASLVFKLIDIKNSLN